jgi:hypothetical protein
VQDGAVGIERDVDDAREGAGESTRGADSDDRGKLRGKPAVSVHRALALIDVGDVEGARCILADLLELL